jgi:hypothetical protein
MAPPPRIKSENDSENQQPNVHPLPKNDHDLLHGRKPTDYLPPGGCHYDQHDLERLFPDAFTIGVCWCCLEDGCEALYPEACDKNCGICGYKIHQGKVSISLLYFVKPSD